MLAHGEPLWRYVLRCIANMQTKVSMRQSSVSSAQCADIPIIRLESLEEFVGMYTELKYFEMREPGHLIVAFR